MVTAKKWSHATNLPTNAAIQAHPPTLQNNASIDSNPGTDDPNGPDGKTVAAARFNQRFFEGTLGWDFNTVWQWDAANNRPSLRPNAGAGQPNPQLAASDAGNAPMQDLLTRQVQANIWL